MNIPNEMQQHISVRCDHKMKISNLQHQLIQMGFEIHLVNKVLLHFEVTSLEMALDYITKENGKWNHPYVKIEHLKADKCIVCSDPSRLHHSHFYNRALSGPVEQARKNNSVQSELALGRKNISFEQVWKYKSLEMRKVKGKEKEMIEERRRVICHICMSEIERPFKCKCQHRFCRECMVDYIKSKIYSSDVEDIQCPEGNMKCGGIIGEDVIKNLLDEKDIDRYYKFLNRAKIAKIPNSVFCPILDCTSYAIKPSQTNEPADITRNTLPNPAPASSLPIFLTCVDNHHFFCLKCKRLAHYGKMCDVTFEKEFQRWIGKEDVRPCPKCGFFIQKNEGCNHMTCGNRSCKYQFCWICMKDYTDIHYTNPLLPCFGLGFINQRNLLVRHPWLRFFKQIFLLLFFTILICMAISLASVIVMFVFMMIINHSFLLVFNRLGPIRAFILLGTSLGLGIALLPVGYMIVILALAILPLVGLAFLIIKYCKLLIN